MAETDWEKGKIQLPSGESQDNTDWDAGEIKPPLPPKGFTGHVRDASLSALKSAISVPESAVGLGDVITGGRTGKAAERLGFRPAEAKEIVSDLHTDAYKDQQQQFQEADGVIGKGKVALKNPSMISNTVVESLGLIGSGAVAGRQLARHAAQRAVQRGVPSARQAAAAGAVGGGAAGEGLSMAGMQAAELRGETEDGLLSPVQQGAAVATGAAGALFGWAGGRLAQRLGIGDVDTMLVQGLASPEQVAAELARQPIKSVPRQIIEGMLVEGLLEELPQETSEQIIENLALGRPWYENLDAAMVMGTLSGMAMGGAASGYRSLTRPSPQAERGEESPAGGAPTDEGGARPSQQMGIDPDAGPMSSAAAVAVDSGASSQLAEQAMLDAAAPETMTATERADGTQEQTIEAEPTGAQRAQAAGEGAADSAAEVAEAKSRVVSDAGRRWAEMSVEQRRAVADQTDLRGILKQNVASGDWDRLNEGVREKLAAAMGESEVVRPVLQNRDRSTPANIAQMRQIAARPDYGRLGFSRDFANGAPVVESGGSISSPDHVGVTDYAVTGRGRRIPVQYAVVEARSLLPSNSADGAINPQYEQGAANMARAIAGNGRVAGLQAAYLQDTAGDYRQGLLDDVDQYGIDPAVVEPMQAPVLVRIMPQDEVTDTIGDESNISGVASLSPQEQARTDVRRINVEGLAFTEAGNLSDAAVRQFVQSMPESERSGLMDGLRPNRRAVERLESAVFAAAYDSDALVRLQSAAIDPEARTVMSGLLVAAPRMVRLRDAGEYDIRPLVAEAAEAVINARRSGRSLTDLLDQGDFSRSPEIEPILRMMAENVRSARRVGASLQALADGFYNEANKADVDMFGTVERRSKDDLLGEWDESGDAQAARDAAGAEHDGADAERQGADRRGSAVDAQSAPAEAEQAAPEVARPERRRDSAERKRVEQMSEQELRAALHTDELTGLLNRRAYMDNPRLAYQTLLDVDSLKFVNDAMGLESGDVMLRLFGEAISEQTDQGYRLGGDEFIVQTSTEAEAHAMMARIAARLEEAELTVELPDGRGRITKQGLEFSYGTGRNSAEANAALQAHEAERVRQGLRADRGEEPRGVIRSPAEGQQDRERQAAAEAVAPDLEAAAHEAATSPENDLKEPTQAQKDAGNYKKGHIAFNGHDISIENPAGSKRRPEWPALKNHYGYFKNTVGKDKDHVDVFMAERATDPDLPVFVVDQVNQDGSFDEHKVVLGADNEVQARNIYLGNYAKGWTGLGAITRMSQDEFRAWAYDERLTSKPAAGTLQQPSGKRKGAAAVESTAPEHQQVGVDDRELAQIAEEFNHATLVESQEGVHHLFDQTPKKDVVRLQHKAKLYHDQHGWMTVAEAKAKIDEWKQNAISQGQDPASRNLNNNKVVLSFFDLSGEWSKPWREAGYQVFQFDIQDDPNIGDVHNFSTEFFNDHFGSFEGHDIHAILAACPCTDFASSGARHFAAKDADGRTVASVNLVHRTLAAIEYFKPAVWAIENPVGRIERLTGLPNWRLSFDPNHLGDPYTKRTLIWGRFNGDLPVAPVEPTEGSKMHRLYGGRSLATKNARSVTPEGFAYGFFQANNAIDNPVMTISNKYDRLDSGVIERAVQAGLSEQSIDSAVQDAYYIEMDDAAAEQALRDAIAEHKQGSGEATASEAVETVPASKAVEAAPAPIAEPVAESETAAKDAERFAGNTIFTVDKVAAARARIKAKLGQLNSGIDPELMVDGMTIAGAYVESGVRSFSQYAKNMTADFGDKIKPYLLSFWEATRNYPGVDNQGMTSVDESAKLHAELLTPAVRESVSEAVGEVAKKPTRRPRKRGTRGDQVLTQDWGAEQIDGYSDSYERESGNDTKDAFLKETRQYLNAVADALKGMGYQPHLGRNGRPGQPVSVNESGMATSGDVSLTMRNLESGQNVYIYISGTSLRGTVPTTPSGISVMYRVGSGDSQYASGARNNWAPVDLSANELAALVTSQALPAQQEASDERPADGDADQGGAEAVRGGRGAAAQQQDPSSDSGDVEAGQPDHVRPDAAAEGAGRSGVREPRADVAPDAGVQGQRHVPDRREGASREGSSDAGAGSTGDAARSELSAPANATSPAASKIQARDLHIDNPLEVVGGTQVQRFNRNREALELLQVLEAEGRQATADEQRVLAGYTGWGSFGQDLFQGTWEKPVYRKEAAWQERAEWLRDTLGEAAWKSAQRSITNAHYTDPPTVMAMWDMVRRMGFEGGRVLEPAMGTGNFFSMMPADLKSRSQLTGIELDETTGAIAKQLFPQSNIQVMGYQDSKTPDNFYDLVIGNWPFENTPIADRRYNKFNPMLHDYFFLKTIDQVRPGGIVIGITSAGSMDKQSAVIRRELAKSAELLASIRLPSGAFADYAGTSVVTDIVVLRKRPEKLAMVPEGTSWIEAAMTDTPSGEQVRVNSYYINEAPQNILGTLDHGHGAATFRAGMIVHRPENMAERLRQAVELVPSNSYEVGEQTDHLTYYANETGERHGALSFVGDKLMVTMGDQMAEANEVVKYALKDAKRTAAREQEIRDAIGIRQRHSELVDAERANQDADAPRQALKQAYQAFVKAHGTLRDSFALRYMQRIDDPFYASVAALENDDGTAAAVMERSTTRSRRTLDNPSVRDAYVLARNQQIIPSMDEVARLSGKSVEAVKAELQRSGALFEAPNGDMIPSDIYLSGNVRMKLREAQAALEDGNQAMQANIAALQGVMPEDVPYFNIETKLGATWVPTSVYQEYIAHMLGRPNTDGIRVGFLSGRWSTSLDGSLNKIPEASTNFGSPHVPFSRLIQAAMSNRTLRLTSRNSDGNEAYDAVKSEAVNAQIAKIREEFGAWLWSDPERRQELELEYNESRNAWATPRYDGSFLAFEGMALELGESEFNLRQHQADAIWRAIVNRRSLNAHEVGTGKTFTMGGIAIESRRYGIAKKPMILAHNANSATVAAEIRMMYPSARVLYVDNLSPKDRDIRLRQIANDDWDAVVVPHSLIDRLAMREETLMAMAEDDIAALEAEFFEAAKEDGINTDNFSFDDDEAIKKLRSVTAKELAKARKTIIETIRKQAQQSSRESAVPFEDLGVDMILVDEVHEFKKPPIVTSMQMKGLNTQVSQRSTALQFLTRYVRQMNNGGNVHTFTGTPITNTITEIYHQMRYVMESEMEAAGVADWDGWFGSFATETQDVELSTAGDYEMVTRLAGFVNVPELRQMVGQYMDTVFAEDMPEMQPRKVNGKTLSDSTLTEAERAVLMNGRTEGASDRPYKQVVNDSADMSDAQVALFSELQQYAKEWRDASGNQRKIWQYAGDPRSPIITGNIADAASFDIRMADESLVGQEGKAPLDPSSKVARAVDRVLEIYNSHAQATQVVFADSGIHKSVRRTRSDGDGGTVSQTVQVFSPVHDMIERLVQGGIPREQIALVSGATSRAKRKEIAEAMNEGSIRVVFGSTDSLGVGVNMQRNLRAMHHLDAPYMPGELEQRNGRGHRQGNQWNTVLEYRYMTDRLDGRRWQILAVKQRFINAFMKSDNSARTIEGEAAAEEQSDILESFSEAAGDPRILQRVKLSTRIESLLRRERTYTQGVADMRRTERRSRERAAELTEQIERIEQSGTLDKLTDLIRSQQEAFKATIDGKSYSARKDATEALQAYAHANMRVGEKSRVVGEYAGHPIKMDWPNLADAPVTTIEAFGERFDGRGIAGAEARLRNFPKRVETLIESRDAELATAENMVASMAQPFGHAEALQRARDQLNQLEQDLAINPVPAPTWLRQGAPIDSEVYQGGQRYIVTGHRYSKEGWFVLAEDAKGAVVIPYLEATDSAAMPIYEAREFVAPVVIEKKKEGGEEEAQFSRDGAARTGMAADEVVKVASRLMRNWQGRPAVRVVQGEQELPAAIRAAIDANDAWGTVNAVFFKGDVYIVADRMGSEADVQTAVLHEVMGHYGLRTLLGDRLKPTLNQVWAMHGQQHPLVQEIIGEYFTGERAFDVKSEQHRHTVAEELVAHLAERNERPKLLSRVIGLVREWLRRNGFARFASGFNAHDLALLMHRARQVVEQGSAEIVLPQPAYEGFSRSAKDAVQAQVDSNEFRAWFGDWKDPAADSSLVTHVDGTPKVMYHGTHGEFSRFRASSQANGLLFFTEDPAVASEYAQGDRSGYGNMSRWEDSAHLRLIAEARPDLFDGLHLKPSVSGRALEGVLLDSNIGMVEALGERYQDKELSAAEAVRQFNDFVDEVQQVGSVMPVYLNARRPYNDPLNPIGWHRAERHGAAYFAEQGYDSVYVTEGDGVAMAVIRPDQVKSAVGNTGEFSPDSDDILHSRSSTHSSEAPTDTPQFKAWFGDSKVVNAQGQPLVVYHGSPDVRGLLGEGFKSISRGNVFFAARDYAVADSYADDRRAFDYQNAEPQTIPLYLSIKNPMVIDAQGQHWRETEKHVQQAKDRGHDGIIIHNSLDYYNNNAGGRPTTVYAWFEASQAKSAIQQPLRSRVDGEPIAGATANEGGFDPVDPRIQFSRSNLGGISSRATAELNRTFSAPGKLSKWHTSVGTMYNLAQRSPAFKKVFDSAQGFIDDVSFYANDAAAFAQKLLPSLESIADIAKSPISAADNAAIERPINEGTLLWGRDAHGRPVLVEDLERQARGMSVEQKLEALLTAGKIEPRVAAMWRGMSDEQLAQRVAARYESQMLQAGVVWSPSELQRIFKLTGEQQADGSWSGQIGLYHEFRNAVNRSLDTMGRADMLRFAGKDLRHMRKAVMEEVDIATAAELMLGELQRMAEYDPDRRGALMQIASGIRSRAQRVTQLQDQGYAPLSRFGRYTVDVVVNGERQYFGLFETGRAANLMAEQMKAEFGEGNVTQGTLSNEAYRLFAGITPESVELFGNMLGLDSTGNTAQDHAFQEYLRLTTTNRSAMRRLIRRKGIAGYSTDPSRVLAAFVYSNARQTAAGLNMGDLGEAVEAIPKHQGELKDVAVRLSEYIKNPQEEAQAARSLLFAQYLGGSVASAFVNITQPFAVTFPWLSQYGGAAKAAAALGKAAKDMSTKGFRYEPGLAAALEEAENAGVVSPQEVHQLMAQARGAGHLRPGDGTRAGDLRAKGSNAVSRLSLAWGKLFGAAEQVNRRVTFIAAYRVAESEGMENPAEFARSAVRETQFIYSKANKMQWGRGAIGGTLMTFKTYSIAYIELMNRLWNQGEAGSVERRQGRKAAMLMIATLFLVGGAGGLPFMENLEDVIDAAAQLMGYNFSVRKAREQFFIDLFGDELAEFMDRGLSGLPGVPVDVSGRLGLGRLIPGTGLLQKRTSHTRDLLEIAGPGGDLASRVLSGVGSIASGVVNASAHEVGAGLLEMAPTAVRNVAKGVDMTATGMYRDSKGYKVLDTNLLEAAAKSMGFQPYSVSEVQEANWINQRSKAFYNMRAQEIRQLWAAGIFEGDPAKVQRARKQIADWNAKNPDQRMLIRIPDVMRRVREMRKDKSRRIADTAPRAMRAQMRRDLLRRHGSVEG